MKLLIVAAIAATCLAAPQDDDARNAQITEYRSEPGGNGGYHFAYRTSDGTYREETGVLKNPGTENQIMEVVGVTRWTADGREFSVSFIANENGYVIRDEPQPERRPTGLGVQPPKIRRPQRTTSISHLGR